ncbi:hypothetical protein [Actinomycetospora succinea]|uniref:hypothetical protein n=1 Tax=Actinomycetospora succinea TaxID=663603 RepID=UPI001FB6FCAE|nr:hypothetical protein [Actinomycetospora succinea]
MRSPASGDRDALVHRGDEGSVGTRRPRWEQQAAGIALWRTGADRYQLYVRPVTTQRQLRKTALGLRHAEETTDGQGRPAFVVDGRPFAVLEAGQVVVLTLPPVEAEELITACPAAQRVDGTGVRLALAEIDGQQLNAWVRRAWAAQAPAAIAENADAAPSAQPGEVGDLPRAIGRAATRALADLGITTMDRVATMSDRELLAIHGVGPKAVRLLRGHAGT